MASDNVDYKAKYIAIRDKLIQSVDTAHRMGYQIGFKDAQMQNMQAQMQQAQQQAQMAQQQVGQLQQAQAQQQPQDQQSEGQSAQETPNQEQNPELDQYINELETLVNKSELNPADLMKSIEKIKSIKQPKAFSQSYTHNMPADAKKDLGMQEKIVSDILKNWEKQQDDAMSSVGQAIGIEGLLSKKE